MFHIASLCRVKRLWPSPRTSRTGRASSSSYLRLICTLLFVAFVYGFLVFSSNGSLTSLSDTAATASPSALLPRWFNFTDDVFRMHADDRRIIVLYATTDMDTSAIEKMLERHPSVLYFGNILSIQPEHLRFVEEQNSLAIVRDLFDCSQNTLSYFVDYVNANLLGKGQPVWCGSNRRTQMQAVDLGVGSEGSSQAQGHRLNYSACKTVRKSTVKSFCQGRHLAVKSQDRSWTDGLAKTHADRIKLIHMTFAETNTTADSATEPADNVDFTLEYSYARRFSIRDFYPKPKPTALLELYNFLDLYVDKSSRDQSLNMSNPTLHLFQ